MMASVTEEFSSILSHFKLREDDCRKPVTSKLLDEISLKYCADWKFLSSQLEIEDYVVEDIDHKPIDEKGKRREFFREWRQRKGLNATYERLILALLNCERRRDAEKVCELLRGSLEASSVTASVTTCDRSPLQPSSSPAEETTHMPVTTSSLQQPPSTVPATASTHDHTTPQQGNLTQF